jgi:hypothetical protein
MGPVSLRRWFLIDRKIVMQETRRLRMESSGRQFARVGLALFAMFRAGQWA